MFVNFAELTQASVAPTDATALIPLAAMETHGPHLPLGTDTIIVNGIIDRAAALDHLQFCIYRCPTLWLGTSPEHEDNPGSLSLEPEHLIDQITAVGRGLARCGIRRVLLFNAHGGNVAAATIAAMKLRIRHDMLVASAHWMDFGLPRDLASPASVEEDIHGGWVETSVLLHLTPHLVMTGAAVAAQPVSPARVLYPQGNIQWAWKTSDLVNGGWVGRPDLATADLGRELVAHAAARLVETLHGLAAAAWPPTR